MSWSRQREIPTVPLTDAVRSALYASGYELASDPQLAAVVEALRDDKFILAVKHYRAPTGAGLPEARAATKYLESELRLR